MFSNIIMNVQLFLLLLFGFANTFAGEKNQPCVTPNNETATCTSLVACEEIYTAVSTGGKEAREFARKSLCSFDGLEPLVCCGSVGLPSATVVSKDREELLKDFDLGTSLLPDRSLCGLVEKKYKISGRKFTDFTEFPWSAALEYTSKETKEKKIKCGGTLINNRFVLTAAHCLKYSKYQLTAVLLGEWKLSTDPDCLVSKEGKPECAPPVQRFGIAKEIPHYFYSSRNMTNDIALIKLEKEIAYDGFVRPICLPPLNVLPSPSGTFMTVTGWGANENGTLFDSKTKKEMPLVADCQEKLKPLNIKVSKNHQCLRSEDNSGSCFGDSGGAVMKMYKDVVFNEDQWYLIGVISWIKECANPEYPIIFHRLPRYLNWIIYTMTEDEYESSTHNSTNSTATD